MMIKITSNNKIAAVTHFFLFILVFNQLDAQNFVYDKSISCLCVFRAHVLIIRSKLQGFIVRN